jgi:hypothetical protein
MQFRYHRVLLLLGLAAGSLAGACEKTEEETPVEERCRAFDGHATSCHGHAYEGCGDPCNPECNDRGLKAKSESGMCNELWLKAYDCVLELECEEFLVWEEGRLNDKTGYPCEQLELDFRADCDAPLWSGEK